MEIAYILKLARLEVREKEKKELQEDFSSILEFVNKLEEVEVKQQEIPTRGEEFQDRMRKDKASPKKKRRDKELVDLVSQEEEGYIRTYQIL